MRTPHTPKPEKAKQVQCWFDPELLASLDQEAKRVERSRSYLVAKAVEQYLRRTGTRKRGDGTRSEGRASMYAPSAAGTVEELNKRATKAKPAKSKIAEEVPAASTYNPLIDFIEAKELAKAMKPAKKGK